jgi:hypothetical protein
LIAGIIGNLVMFMYNRGEQSRIQSKIAFLFTLVILGLIVPHYYSTFKLDLAHFLEHSFLKLLFTLNAVNLIFLISVSPSPIDAMMTSSSPIGAGIEEYYKTMELEVFDNGLSRISSPIGAGIEEYYKTMELEVFDNGLSKISTRSAQFLERLNQLSSAFDIETYFDNAPRYMRNILESIDGAINWLWNRIAAKSESIPDILSNMQTGLLSNNLILVLGFLMLFIILLILVPRG